MLGFVLCLWDLPPRNFTAGSGGVSTVVRQVEKKKIIIKKQTNSQEEGVYSQVDRCRDVHQSSTLKKWYLAFTAPPLRAHTFLSVSKAVTGRQGMKGTRLEPCWPGKILILFLFFYYQVRCR